MSHFAVIVVGASAGGVEALLSLAADLPSDLPAAMLVAQHIGRHPSTLPELMTRAGALPARHAVQGQAIAPGQIYVAPSDHHFLVHGGGRVLLTRGPRENWARPAIDPLFRSAARVYGARVIGVILTGMLNDGSAGLQEVRRAGGIAVVQDPADAARPEMPASALRHAGADHRVPLAVIGNLLAELAEDIATRSQNWPKAQAAAKP